MNYPMNYHARLILIRVAQVAALTLCLMAAAVAWQAHADHPHAHALAPASTMSQPTRARRAPVNLLIVTIDDISQRELPSIYGNKWSYGTELVPHTPNLDALAAAGTVVTGLHSSANCSPSRTSIQTGRYPHRFGIGTNNKNGPFVPLGLTDEVPMVFMHRAYVTAMFGKWGMGDNNDPGWKNDLPLDRGWGTLRASTYRTNFVNTVNDDWTEWTRNDDGVLSQAQGYAPQVQAQAAADWIGERTAFPWFAQLNLVSPHKPVHVPPAELLTNYHWVQPGSDPRDLYVAAIEALDATLEPVIRAVDLDDTLVVVVGDNGTPPDLAHPLQTPEKLKKTLYREGIEVPCIIAGARSAGLVARGGVLDLPTLMYYVVAAATDQFAPDTWDGGADVPLDSAYAELRIPNGGGPYDERQQMVRMGAWKLLRIQGKTDKVFDLVNDPTESYPLDPADVPVTYGELLDLLQQIE